jgi:hypothetical protein
MKKEMIFGGILVCLFVLSLINIHMLDKMTGELTGLLDESLKSAESGDWESAVKKAEEAEALWNKADPYTHIVVRHSEIDTTTDAFYEVLKALYSKNLGMTKGSCKDLNSHISSIVSMEKVTFGSIF